MRNSFGQGEYPGLTRSPPFLGYRSIACESSLGFHAVTATVYPTSQDLTSGRWAPESCIISRHESNRGPQSVALVESFSSREFLRRHMHPNRLSVSLTAFAITSCRWRSDRSMECWSPLLVKHSWSARRFVSRTSSLWLGRTRT